MNLAIRLARQSKMYRGRHGAVIVNGGLTVAIGINKCNHYSKTTRCGVHAEQLAIRLAKATEGADMYVARVTQRRIGMSKPCPKCLAAIKRAGIKRVFYSHDDGTWGALCC